LNISKAIRNKLIDTISILFLSSDSLQGQDATLLHATKRHSIKCCTSIFA